MEFHFFERMKDKIKIFLIDGKNKKLLFLFIIFFLIFLTLIILLNSINKKKSFHQKNQSYNSLITISPLIKKEEFNKKEIIISAAFNINCQIIVTTSLKKIYLQRLDSCPKPLSYLISPSGRFLAYFINERENKKKIFIYSLANNIETFIDTIPLSTIDFLFLKSDDIVILSDNQSLVYYFISLLFSGYPRNFDTQKNIFIDIEKKKLIFSLPDLQKEYKKIIEKDREIVLLDKDNREIYAIPKKEIIYQLTPTPLLKIDKKKLDWSKRILLFDGKEFKSFALDGSNELSHKVICQDKEIIPLQYFDNFFSRSPDGKILAFVIPEERQIKENPDWKNEVLAKKKPFFQGEIVLYDLTKDWCELTGLKQTLNFNEKMSFSPNGLYLAYVNNGINLYVLTKKQTFQLVSYNRNADFNSSMTIGNLIWDSESRFIFTTVAKVIDNQPLSPKLVRISFNQRFEGKEEEIVDLLSHKSFYAGSADGNQVLYSKDENIQILDINTNISSLFKNESRIEEINKIVWLRNNKIVSNIWYFGIDSRFYDLPKSQEFQVDFDGEWYIYKDNLKIKVYNLEKGKENNFQKNLDLNSILLPMYY